MFTGIVEGIGTIKAKTRRGYSSTFEIAADFDMGDVNVGDSISVDGCCLTVTSRLGSHFWADLSDETLRVTAFGNLEIGSHVNLERALKVGDRLGGHIVLGHVDGVGKIMLYQDVENTKELVIKVPIGLARYIVDKGSLTVNGISLTVNKIVDDAVSIRLIPHTISTTTFREKSPGDHVNLEVDIIGKYVEKLGFSGVLAPEKKGSITEEYLKKHGF